MAAHHLLDVFGRVLRNLLRDGLQEISSLRFASAIVRAPADRLRLRLRLQAQLLRLALSLQPRQLLRLRLRQLRSSAMARRSLGVSTGVSVSKTAVTSAPRRRGRRGRRGRGHGRRRRGAPLATRQRPGAGGRRGHRRRRRGHRGRRRAAGGTGRAPRPRAAAAAPPPRVPPPRRAGRRPRRGLHRGGGGGGTGGRRLVLGRRTPCREAEAGRAFVGTTASRRRCGPHAVLRGGAPPVCGGAGARRWAPPAAARLHPRGGPCSLSLSAHQARARQFLANLSLAEGRARGARGGPRPAARRRGHGVGAEEVHAIASCLIANAIVPAWVARFDYASATRAEIHHPDCREKGNSGTTFARLRRSSERRVLTRFELSARGATRDSAATASVPRQ